jgi:hypothetical protein
VETDLSLNPEDEHLPQDDVSWAESCGNALRNDEMTAEMTAGMSVDELDEEMEDSGPFVIRPSWNIMLAQLAGEPPASIRVSDFGRGSRVISRALSGDQEERDLDLDEEDDDAWSRPPMH